MNPADFRLLLARVGLTQTELVTLTGISLTTINRYCSRMAADRAAVPPGVVALVLAWELLSDRSRATLRARLATIHEEMMVAVYCFTRGWAVEVVDGAFVGWTHDIAKAGRWRRRDTPEEFGTLMVDDPHWPVPEGATPIPPDTPPRPKPARKRKRGV